MMKKQQKGPLAVLKDLDLIVQVATQQLHFQHHHNQQHQQRLLQKQLQQQIHNTGTDMQLDFGIHIRTKVKTL
jgi:hypothetical protein